MIIDHVCSKTAKYEVKVTCPGDVLRACSSFTKKRQEHFLVCTLNGAHEIQHVHILSIGLMNRTIVHPREVFKLAIQDMAAAIIIVHNHPSGNLDSSEEDRNITKRLKEAGEIMGIPVLDHVIIGKLGYRSLMEVGQF